MQSFLNIFAAFFPDIWPLAGPNIAKKGGLLKRVGRYKHWRGVIDGKKIELLSLGSNTYIKHTKMQFSLFFLLFFRRFFEFPEPLI